MRPARRQAPRRSSPVSHFSRSRFREREGVKRPSLCIAALVLGLVIAVDRVTHAQVVLPPSISKAFEAATIPLNGTTTLSFQITNPNPLVALTGVAFTD